MIREQHDPTWILRKNIEHKMSIATEAYRQVCLVYEECYRALWDHEDMINGFREIDNE